MLEEKIGRLFIKKKITLSVAESCTGGEIASRLVSIPDASHYFQGGVIAYSNQAKQDLLGVRFRSLKEYGAVSEMVASEMAEGALNIFHTTYALATTGIAGPDGGSSQKPVGTVAFALAKKDGGILSWISLFTGERKKIIEQAAEEALSRLYLFELN